MTTTTTTTTTTTKKVRSPLLATVRAGSRPQASARAGGGRATSAVPQGEGTFSGTRGLSQDAFRFGGSQSSLASVHGVVSAVLVTLAALVAFAVLLGGSAALRTIRRQRLSAGRHTRAQRGTGRTREELYSEARRQNIKGRSRMNKAQLERALGER